MKYDITKPFMSQNVFVGYLVFLSQSMCLAFAASILTVFVAPNAAGGGTVEIMGYFNGI